MGCISLTPPDHGDARIEERISALAKFAMQRVDVAHLDEHRRPWRSIVVMRGQMQPHAIAGDVHVHAYGYSWAEISSRLGISCQAAQQRRA